MATITQFPSSGQPEPENSPQGIIASPHTDFTKPEAWTAALLSLTGLERFPAQSWLIEKLLPRVGLGLLFGQSGTLKTFVLLDMLLSIAAGIPFCGFRTTKSRVVYIALEGQQGILNRVRAWLLEHPEARADVEQNFRVILVPFELFTASEQGVLRAFIEGLRPFAPALVAIDTLSRTMGSGDENANVDMGFVIRACQEIERLLGVLMMLVHHQAKNANKAKPTPRGASNLPAAADVILHASRTAARLTLRLAKQKNAAEIEDLLFTPRVVNLGERDGEPQTSLVLVPQGDALIDVPERESAEPEAQAQILSALAEAKQPLRASDLAERIEGKRKASGSLNRALVDLCERGLIQKRGTAYCLPSACANLHAA